MTTPIAINGLGRIGRALLRIAHGGDDLQVVAINDLAPAERLVPLIARDTIHGRFPGAVEATAGGVAIDGREIPVFNQAQPETVPWGDTDARVVVEATGKFLSRETTEGHLQGRVTKVLLSGNAERVDLTICLGVNDDSYDAARHTVLSAGSCTTNCLAPVAYLLDREHGIERALLNTVHSYNNDQRLLELPHRDPRRARAAGLNMIPTTTSAVRAVTRVLPQLEGRIDGLAVRVPTPNVSLIDLTVELRQPTSTGRLERLFRDAAAGELAGILAASDEQLVSMDFLRDPHSSIVDLPLLQVVDGRMCRVIAWYDNEWGHASRLADLAARLGE